jgi:hypothetical protein
LLQFENTINVNEVVAIVSKKELNILYIFFIFYFLKRGDKTFTPNY